jgi:hypothetical protein
MGVMRAYVAAVQAARYLIAPIARLCSIHLLVCLGLLAVLAQPVWPEVASAQPDVVRAPSSARSLDTDLLESEMPGGATSGSSGATVARAGRFSVVSFPRDRKLADNVLRAAQRNDSFPGVPRPTAKVLIAIAPDNERFRAWAGPSAPEWGAAVAFPALQRIIMQGSNSGSDAGDPLVTLRHELAHLALHEFMGDVPSRWFDEGYASVAAGEWGREEALAASVGLALRGVPTLDELELMFYRGAGDAQMAYALAHRAVSDLMLLDNQRGLSLFFASWKSSASFELALRGAFGLTSGGFEQQWQKQTRRRYGALALLANLSLALALFSIILGPLIYHRRKRDRARLEAMRRADAVQERADRESMLAAMLAVSATAQAFAGSSDAPDGPVADVTNETGSVDKPS